MKHKELTRSETAVVILYGGKFLPCLSISTLKPFAPDWRAFTANVG